MSKSKRYRDSDFFERGCYKNPDPENPLEKISCGGCAKLNSHDWLNEISPPYQNREFEIVEVRFKNSKKEFFKSNVEMNLECGDIVAVETASGHDIGIVSLTGPTVKKQMKKKKANPEQIKRIYRRARSADIDKWIRAVQKEESTKLKSRQIAADLNLDMKINDIEYQGDGTKAIFYYTAEERVDFREMIKVLAEKFRIRIEMKQIGARQEAGRLGGIGSCGREMCCASWLTDFRSVTTNSARTQQLSLNPQKLTGQCGKLKCCLNYELDFYTETIKNFPDSDVVLKTKKGEAIHQKSDVFRKIMWYAYVENQNNLMGLPVDKVSEIIKMNNKDVFPEKLEDYAFTQEQKNDFENVVGQDDLDRFD